MTRSSPVGAVYGLELSMVARQGTGGGRRTDRLFEAVYEDLCRMARRLAGAAGTTDPSALVHETYLSIRRRHGIEDRSGWSDTERFRFLTGLAMKTVARDRRRREGARKRGGGHTTLALQGDPPGLDTGDHGDVLALRQALRRLAVRRPRWLAAVLLHDIEGRTIEETARRMRVRPGTVRTYRRSALRWLRSSLESTVSDV